MATRKTTAKKSGKKRGLSPGLLAYMAKQRALKAGKTASNKKSSPKSPKAKSQLASAPKSKKRKKQPRAARPLYHSTGVAGIVPPLPEKRQPQSTEPNVRPLY